MAKPSKDNMLKLTYIRKKSVFHNASPFLKITWILSILMISVIFEHPIILFIIFLSPLLMAAISKIFNEWSKVMKLVVYFFHLPFCLIYSKC